MKIRFILFVFIFSNCYVIAIGNEDQSAGPGKPTKFRVMSVSSLWLMELEENYKSGFPKQFSVINHRNLSTVRNHNLQREDASTCQDVTFFSVEQNKRMINTFGWDSILNRTIHEILEIPRARLFRDNFDGEIEDYHYSRDVEQNNGININMSYIETTFSSIFNVEFYSRNCSGSYFNKAAEIHRTDRVHCQQVGKISLEILKIFTQVWKTEEMAVLIQEEYAMLNPQ
ncbi:unnamed protein product [Allacma fusca]|uniref:Uncharacterized protein n=1 Tax=Allacma fusca TaxID=39272 RepID=A0A8J2L6V8_9HEXA|nr:unnamed protein product [Allacma fusca]